MSGVELVERYLLSVISISRWCIFVFANTKSIFILCSVRRNISLPLSATMFAVSSYLISIYL